MAGGDKDWQVGDLALRISSSAEWFDLELNMSCNEGPPPGSINRVINVCREREGIGLRFEEWPTFIFSALSFRKIRPHTPDEEDAETIALLTGTPARTPEPVA